MIIHFKFGFQHKGFLFGWHKKELYRLPSQSENRYFALKKLSIILIGNQTGYRCKRDKFSIKQLEGKTILIDKKISIIRHPDCPF